MKASVLALLLMARTASAEVIVNVHLAKPEFIVGEPIQVAVDVTNIGSQSVLLPVCCLGVSLTVPDGTRRVLPSLDSCHPLGGNETGQGTSVFGRTPVNVGETRSYPSLLHGYALSTGRYFLIAEGTVDAGTEPNRVSFTRILEVVVRAGTESELRDAFQPYLDDYRGSDPDRRARALDAILEMAPGFLEATIVPHASVRVSAIDALTMIGSLTARDQLRRISQQPGDHDLATHAALALARLGDANAVDVLAKVLHDADDQHVQIDAVRGLANIGGDKAVRALLAEDTRQPGIMRWVITAALGNTKPALAVTALINRLSDEEVPLSVICDALMDMTRHRWCDATWDKKILRRQWTRWWKANSRKVGLFNAADGCPALPELLPRIQ